MRADPKTTPIDAASRTTLAERGLRYGLVDTDDRDAFTAWLQSESRGFHQGRPNPTVLNSALDRLGFRRTTGVWDDSIPDPDVPVATTSAWLTELTVPGPATVPAWAVTSVAVSATHRRRGIARALMEGELRTALATGAPLAILTASEATIYGRFGYAPATAAVTVEIDRHRVTWRSPRPAGSVAFLDPADVREVAADISERAVRRAPGEITRWPQLLDTVLGLTEPDTDRSRAIRVARYNDPDGRPQGFVVYRVHRTEPESGRIELDHFAAVTDAAYRALWKFVLEQDFISSVTGSLRSIDEPLHWLIEDKRAIRSIDAGDHLWVRVLDPKAALEARRFAGPGRLRLAVDDPLGLADGEFLLDVGADGIASVTQTDAADTVRDDSIPRMAIGVAELGAIYLGGFRPSVLAAAGHVEASESTLTLADRLFMSERAPHLSIGF